MLRSIRLLAIPLILVMQSFQAKGALKSPSSQKLNWDKITQEVRSRSLGETTDRRPAEQSKSKKNQLSNNRNYIKDNEPNKMNSMSNSKSNLNLGVSIICSDRYGQLFTSNHPHYDRCLNQGLYQDRPSVYDRRNRKRVQFGLIFNFGS